MKKFIDVEATAEKIYNKYGTHPAYYVNNTEEGKDAQTDCIVLEMIYDKRRMVYADVEHATEGEWIAVDNCMYSPFDGSDEYVYHCNKCGCESEKASKCCPHCGTRMKEGLLYAKR